MIENIALGGEFEYSASGLISRRARLSARENNQKYSLLFRDSRSSSRHDS
jgi:hypothetical protein